MKFISLLCFFIVSQSVWAQAPRPAPRPIERLPILEENNRGFVLKPLSQRALQLHLNQYKTKSLELVGQDPQTFEEYKKWIGAMYKPGRFSRQQLFLSHEITQALSEPPRIVRRPDMDLTNDRIILKYKMIDARILEKMASKNGLVDIFVPQALYNSNTAYNIVINYNPNIAPMTVETGLTVKAAIDRYIADLEAAGYWVQLYQISGGDHTNIKSTLVNDQKWGLVGSVMIGSLPTAWYRNAVDFHDAPAEFPVDLYFMDLDGVWTDSNGDSKFDSHTGDVEPEIWVGRIGGNAPLTGKSEGQIIAEYLSRNHFFRTQNTAKFPQRLFSHTASGGIYYRALAFHDDDWSGQAASQYLSGTTFNQRVLVNGSVQTGATNYLNMLGAVPGGYFYLHLMAHSNPTGHSFKTGDAWTGGSVSSSDLNTHLRRAHFYNLFNCSGAKYTVGNYLGAMYVFAQDYGLGAIGSSKTGSMLDFDVYYAHLAGKLRPEHAALADDWDVTVGKKETFGTAFLKWFRYIAKGGFDSGEKSWHYGMVHIGDPTLYADWELNEGKP